ncbi:PRC-barrel domain containing protein [Streptomyces xanthochromogenes]|uniref:PRC-barrel domain containing protein n=1 Tax=Streptomyces xanthochromogenes TaxID=67384 RepID=UPI0038015FFD
MSDTMWSYSPTANLSADTDLTGWKVEATDGSIGRIDKHSGKVGSQYIVVDTGVWIFGKEILLTAGNITSVDTDARTVHVGRTKEQIKNAPEFDTDKHLGSPDYHQRIGIHYTDHPGTPGAPGTSSLR